MATQANINLRRANAQNRIDVVREKTEAPPVPKFDRDKDLAQVQFLEYLADWLEEVQEKLKPKPKAPKEPKPEPKETE